MQQLLSQLPILAKFTGVMSVKITSSKECTAVQGCCCLPKQDSKSLEQYDSHLGYFLNRHVSNSPHKNAIQKNKDVPKV